MFPPKLQFCGENAAIDSRRATTLTSSSHHIFCLKLLVSLSVMYVSRKLRMEIYFHLRLPPAAPEPEFSLSLRYFHFLRHFSTDLAQLDLTFIGLLAIFNIILGQSQFLSDMLQSPSMDLATAVNFVEALLDTLRQDRDDNFFEDMWKDGAGNGCKVPCQFWKSRKETVNCVDP